MLEKITAWTAAIFAALIAILAFIGLLLLFRELSGELWTEKAAGWAQAIGSVVAIGVAFHIGAKQSRDAIKAIVFGYDHATLRKYEAYSNIAQAAVAHAEKCLRIFPDGGFNSLSFAIADLNKPSESLINALDAIPIHDVGTYDAIRSLVSLKISMKYLDNSVKRAEAHKKSLGSSMPVTLQFDTGVIQLNSNNVIAHANNLIDALKTPTVDSVPT